MVKKADCQYTVTAAMVRKAAKLKVSDRLIPDTLHKAVVYFRKLREKRPLTEGGVRARLAFGVSTPARPHAGGGTACTPSSMGSLSRCTSSGLVQLARRQYGGGEGDCLPKVYTSPAVVAFAFRTEPGLHPWSMMSGVGKRWKNTWICMARPV